MEEVDKIIARSDRREKTQPNKLRQSSKMELYENFCS